MADEVYFDGSFGDLALLISSISTDEGRDVAIQSPARGSRHFLQDRGGRLRKVDVTVLFVDQPKGGSYLERFDAFRNLVNLGEAQLFTHPLLGAYRARAEGLQHVADAAIKEVRASVTILAEDEPQPVVPVGAGAAPTAGLESVIVAASIATTELDAAGLPSGLPTECVAAVTSWSEQLDELDSQEVFLTIETLTGQIADAIDAYELASDITRWQSYKALIGLSYQLQRAGEAFTSDTVAPTTITVMRAQPLLAISTGLYGPEIAIDMASRIAKLNRIRTPALVPAGTRLIVPLDGP